MTALPYRWTQAALLGSLWAAVEIVLGSFLHNIGMPLAGTVLSALGVCLMVAGSELWPERGIIWRAGVICALMKSVSPSAVIIGPMIGITLEAFLLEGVTRLFGRTPAGYLIGGALATTLPVFQKLIGLVFIYGLDAARLYVALVEFAARSLRVTALGPLDIILIWLGSNLILGAVAAHLGTRAGKLARQIPDPPPILQADQSTYSLGAPDPRQRYSLPLLALHPMLIALGFLAIRDLPLYASAAVIIVYTASTFFWYGRIRRRFSKPRPWIEFTFVAVLAGVVLGGLAAGPDAGPWTGLRIGVQMVLRALLVVVAFSAISIELRNPSVVGWFLRRGLSPLSTALDVAFQALPVMMHAIGEERAFLRHPMASVARALAAARAWQRRAMPPLFVITGPQGSGKTTFLLALARAMRERGNPPGGFAAPVVYEGNDRAGYDLQDLETGERVPLARKNHTPSHLLAGSFAFFPAGIAYGEHVLESAAARKIGVIALDEIGPLELAGSGWSRALSALLTSFGGILLLVVRPDLVEQVRAQWNVHPAEVWKAGEITPEEGARRIGSIPPPGAR